MKRWNSFLIKRGRAFLTQNDLGVILPLFGFGLGLLLWWYFNEIPPGFEEPQFAHFLRTRSGLEPVIWMAGLMGFGLLGVAWRNFLVRAFNLLMVTSFIVALVSFAVFTRITPPFVVLIQIVVVPLILLLSFVINVLRAAMDRCARNEIALAEAMEIIKQLHNAKEDVHAAIPVSEPTALE